MKQLLFLFLLISFAFNTAFAGAQKSKDFSGKRGPSQYVHNFYNDAYMDIVQPIFDKRCVVCHSCYNSPCQLKLSSYEGVMRGATKIEIYDTGRLKAITPTRLFVDAKNAEEWHQKGFFPVVDTFQKDDPKANEKARATKMLQLLDLHQEKGPSTDVVYNSESEDLTCSKDQQELDEFKRKNPHAGMPFGFPKLLVNEVNTLKDWINQGAFGPSSQTKLKLYSPSTGPKGDATLIKWEEFLNQRTDKMILSSRYLYEHLFLAHIHFDSIPGDFYRLVRSRTAYPDEVDEIATERPYDDPGSKFYYRFRKITSTIVHKTHILFHMNDEKMKRIQELFIETDWGVEKIKQPVYSMEQGTNPFDTFEQIPAESRYQFILDNAHYMIMTFIRGPVCRGQIALNVINDYFWNLFIDPKSPLALTDKKFLEGAKKHLGIPPVNPAKIFKENFFAYKKKQRQYMKFKDHYLSKLKNFEGPSLEDIWPGEPGSQAPVLSVHRHFDSASVTAGIVGGYPKAVMLFDYPLIERVYYSLVVNYNPFDYFMHHLSSRQYMNSLRIESEDNFIGFLPKNARHRVRNSWYQSGYAKFVINKFSPLLGVERESKVEFRNYDVKTELFKQIVFDRLNPETFTIDPINFIPQVPKLKLAESPAENVTELENELQKLSRTSRSFTHTIPEESFDVAFLRFTRSGGDDLVYTIIRNKAHSNVNFMFNEDGRRLPEEDTLHFVRGFVGSYPNLFFVVPFENSASFFKALSTMQSEDDYLALIKTYAIERNHPDFWEHSDWFAEKFRMDDPLQAGLFDLNRYLNIQKKKKPLLPFLPKFSELEKKVKELYDSMIN